MSTETELSHADKANGWWDVTATKNVVGSCLQQIESLRGKLPVGVALAMQRAHTALRESLERVESLSPKRQSKK